MLVVDNVVDEDVDVDNAVDDDVDVAVPPRGCLGARLLMLMLMLILMLMLMMLMLMLMLMLQFHHVAAWELVWAASYRGMWREALKQVHLGLKWSWFWS